jgi:hypothetical protein
MGNCPLRTGVPSAAGGSEEEGSWGRILLHKAEERNWRIKSGLAAAESLLRRRLWLLDAFHSRKDSRFPVFLSCLPVCLPCEDVEFGVLPPTAV